MPAKLPALPDPERRRWFRRRLLDWYRRNGRDLPWRKTTDPYHILVSEVMLQQTQVDRVLPKYAEWLDKYPSLHELAAAPVEDVAETWRPLGYNIRPRRLHDIARESVANYGGELPSDEETLLSFKGIGEYTAGAVLSFAFGQRKAILDTNVARVLFRVFVGRGEGFYAPGPIFTTGPVPGALVAADMAGNAPVGNPPGPDGLIDIAVASDRLSTIQIYVNRSTAEGLGDRLPGQRCSEDGQCTTGVCDDDVCCRAECLYRQKCSCSRRRYILPPCMRCRWVRCVIGSPRKCRWRW